MSLSPQHTMKSLAMTSDFEEKLVADNGVVSASKILQGGQVSKKKGPRRVEKPSGQANARMPCSICGSACRDRRSLRNHFVVCVGRNGNPNGACWDDSLKPDYAANKRFDSFPSHLVLVSLISYSSNHSIASLGVSAPPAALSKEAKLDERYRKTEEGLAAVNGIVIPSKLSAGQLPNQGEYERNERQVHPCIICDRRFAARQKVRLHFPACVKRNGNPTGARWNDAWNGAASQVGHMGAQIR